MKIRVLSRRDFMKLLAGCAVALGLYAMGSMPKSESPQPPLLPYRRLASHYRKLSESVVQCELCFRRCVIPNGGAGHCTNRRNEDGRLYNVVYERPCAVQIDPIEKEPQFHMLPGSRILCIGTAGCNFKCNFCQNWPISTRSIEDTGYVDFPCEEVVRQASRSSLSISFTYNEPTVAYEYLHDTVKLAREVGVRSLFHTNGGMNPEALRDLLRYVDAVTVDLKAFHAGFYQVTSVSDLAPVLENLKIIKQHGMWLEIVNLIIPTLNDDLNVIREMCMWIRDNLGENVPLHFNRFFPAYKLQNLLPTPVETLEAARKVALDEGLSYVYVGNVPGHLANSTFCPSCSKRIIHRKHFSVLECDVKDGMCRFCGQKIPGVWSGPW